MYALIRILSTGVWLVVNYPTHHGCMVMLRHKLPFTPVVKSYCQRVPHGIDHYGTRCSVLPDGHAKCALYEVPKYGQ